MIPHKQIFRRLNLNVDPLYSKPDEYSYLLNGIPIQQDAGADVAIRNVLGNILLENADIPAGTNKIIGSFSDVPNSRAIFFLQNSGNNHTIYVVNYDQTITRVMRWSGFNFSTSHLINSFVLGDLLIWTDNSEQINQISISKAIAGATYTPTKDEISLIKRPPKVTLKLVGYKDLSFPQNFIYGNSFQIYCRYIYEDNQASVWSSFANLPFDTSVDPISDQNAIQVTMSISIGDPQHENIPATVKQIDYAVRINGTNLVQIYRSEFRSSPLTTAFAGDPHSFYNNIIGEAIADNQSFKWNDDVPLKSKALAVIKNRLFLLNNTEGYAYKGAAISGFNLSVDTYTALHPEYLKFKRRGSYQAGLMFFDSSSRNAGVQVGGRNTISIPDFDATHTPDKRDVIKWDISGVAQADIPTWADSFALVRTKVNNIAFFLQFISPDTFYYKVDSAGVTTYNRTASASNKGLAIDISVLPIYKMGYVFQAGDRVRLYNKTTYALILDLEIVSQDGKLIFVEGYTDIGMITDIVAGAGVQHFTEIYRPRKISESEPYYEVGQRFAISNPGTVSRAFSVTSGHFTGDTHQALADDRMWNYTYDLAGYSDTDPYANNLIHQLPPYTVGTLTPFEAMNLLSRNFDTWTEQTGRPMTRSLIGSLQFVKGHYVRFGQPYLFDALINLINTFEALDDYPLPLENGVGTGLTVNERVLVAIQQKDATAIYIQEGFVSTSDADRFLAKTENVIGADNKYIGGFGSYHQESIVSYGDRTYFYDIFKGAICRRASNGVTPISEYGISNFIRAISRTYLVDKDTMRFYGGYDPKLDLYLLAIKDNADALLFCLAFHEPSNNWIGFFDYPAENFAHLNTTLLSFKEGAAWIHNNPIRNNFFGVQYNRKLEFNIGGDKVKTWKNINLDAQDIYETAGTNEVIVTATDNGTGFIISGPGGQSTTVNYLDFIKREGVWRSAIFRDMNTPKPFASPTEARYNGARMRSQVLKTQITNNRTDDAYLRAVTILFTPSELSYD